MSQSVILDMKGEHTYNSDISGVPPGSLALGQNININRQGIAEPRRGYDLLAYGLPLGSDRAKKLVFWNSELFIHYGTTFTYYAPLSGPSSRGSLTAPSNATSIRTVVSENKNLYVTSDAGLKKTDAVATSLYAAGVPKGLTIDLSVTGAGTALIDTNYATYSYLLGRKDANSNQIIGGVSGRFTVHNAAGSTQNVLARCYLPSGLDTTYYIQVYKSPNTATTATTEALQQFAEVPLTSTHISNGYVDVTDITSDGLLLGATIYTAPGQQGAVNDNARPPLARDIAEFKGFMFYADVDSPQRLAFTQISSSLAAADTITIVLGATTETYTAHGSVFDSSAKQFVAANSSGSTTLDIDATIKSFIKCVNLASALVYAYSASTSPRDLPGKVNLEARALGTAVFTVTSSRATAFTPQLTSPASINNTSAADTFANGLMFSKKGQPEAVPLKNLFKVGASDDRIKRIKASRDALFIFKAGGGAYILRGENENNFDVKILDATAKLVAPDSLEAVNNLVYGLFAAGICEVSDTGVEIISIPIKDQLEPLLGAPLTAVSAYSFGMGIDVDGKYILAVPTASTDTYSVRQHVFDTFGRTWCKWTLPLTCGGVNPADSKIYLGTGNSNKIKQERKAYDFTDYADYQATGTIASYVTTTLTLDGTSDMAAGDILYQGSNALAYIESVDTVAGTVVIDTEQAWTTGVATVVHMKAVDTKIQWNPDCGGNAAGLKLYYECAVIQKQAFQKEATLYFSSDINPAETPIVITSASGNGAFGQFAFGDEVFGGEQARAPKRVGVPRGHARCSQLSVRFENKVAYSDFQITGLSLPFTPTSTRTTR